MNYIIRKMAVEDLEQVIAIDQISFSLPWPPRAFHAELTKNSAISRCWVAEQDEKIIGMIVAWLIVDEIHIATIAVHPDFRGQGVGNDLLAHTLQFAKEEGAIASMLEVRPSNEAAINMYKKFGYEEVSRRKEYYSDNKEDAILMTLKF